MGKVKNSNFWESAKMNNATFMQYYNRLTELSISMFEWKNLPGTLDERFLELVLFSDGMAVFFKDDVMGYLCLRTMIGGHLNLYQIPTIRTAYASNGYNKTLDENNSVICFNNLLHTNSLLDVEQFAKRLYNLDRIIDVNANAQKTPLFIACDESQRVTMKNLYMQYDGNMPVIYADKSLAPNSLRVLKTDAPYVADKIYTLKTQVWNEALTYLGISNINIQKKERLITDEVTRNQGGVIASRYSRLEARRQFCKQVNAMFNLDPPMWCDYREDFQMLTPENDTIEGEPNSEGDGGSEDEVRNDE